MGEFRRKLQEKVNRNKEREQEKLTARERLEDKRQSLENALVFLEKTTTEAGEGWYIDSCKELTGKGLIGKLGIFRKKLQRKSLHWYLEPVCDDQSVYNRKLLRALTAMEDFATAQSDWNREMQAAYETELADMKAELAELKEQLADAKAEIAKLEEQLADAKAESVGRKKEPADVTSKPFTEVSPDE